MIDCKVMLKKILIGLAVFILVVLYYGYATPRLEAEDYPQIAAESALVMEKQTGAVLWEKNSQQSMYPASTTKMLTAIIAIESLTDLSQLTEISENAAGRNHSAFSFKQGDKVSVLDLIKASLICSHNNATIALAEHISGSEKDFVETMNIKARHIGAYDTFFQNTNGLDSDYPYHRTTARDLAIIAKYCLNNPLFAQIVNTEEDIITIGENEVEINNTNHLLQLNHIKGIKTGFTANAGYCIVTYSDSAKLDLITVILNSTSDSREEDAVTLINYVERNYGFAQVVDQNLKVDTVDTGGLTKTKIDLYPGRSYYQFVNSSEDDIDFKYSVNHNIVLPVSKNQNLGNLEVYINGQFVEEIPLVSTEAVEGPDIEQHLVSTRPDTNKKVMFFAIGFYFLVFIFIIVKNLFFKTKFYV